MGGKRDKVTPSRDRNGWGESRTCCMESGWGCQGWWWWNWVASLCGREAKDGALREEKGGYEGRSNCMKKKEVVLARGKVCMEREDGMGAGKRGLYMLKGMLPCSMGGPGFSQKKKVAWEGITGDGASVETMDGVHERLYRIVRMEDSIIIIIKFYI